MLSEEFKQLFRTLQQSTPAKSLSGVVKRNAAKGYHSRLHRRNWSKVILAKKGLPVDRTLTEWENMQALGYDRIWDCGKKKWAITL